MSDAALRLAREADEVLRAAEAQGRPLSAAERNYVQDLLTRAEGAKQLTVGHQLGAPVTSYTSGGFPAPFGQGPGDLFVQSKAWKDLADPHTRPQQWSTGPVQVTPDYNLKAGTLLEGAGGQGAGLTPVPQVAPGIVTKLFEAPSVVDLIPTSPATTSSLRYMNEGTATSAAAGVAEGGTKPASDIAISTIDEPVKKIATTLTVSDELLDDAVQVQQYLNGRLALFVRLEEERQVLRGTGTNELVGLMGRSINSYNIGSDTPAVGIYKSLVNTRGSANLAPTGIVMHPVNYANIRRGTATTGEFLAGYPIGTSSGTPGIYADNLWGLPVALSTTVGLGTALVGSFAEAAHLYRRGGVSVEASNSHASYFTSDLVALRAEQRMALACFRPGAFTQVTGLGTSI